MYALISWGQWMVVNEEWTQRSALPYRIDNSIQHRRFEIAGSLHSAVLLVKAYKYLCGE